jgi:hypothetical protein
MTTFMVRTRSKKEATKLKAVLKAFDADFQEQEEYNPVFVKKIKDRMENVKNGEYIILTKEYKKELFGL